MPAPISEEEGVEVPYSMLDQDTLERFITEFILREGTDYGAEEVGLERKIEQVRRQLERGDVRLVFNLVTETGSIVPKREKSPK